MSSTLIETNYGKLQGKEENGIYVWKGIPYAQPPIGHLRFKPPVPPKNWSGIQDAENYAPGSLQPLSSFSNILGVDKNLQTSEDCLYLNVWSPGADNKRRPVMVWIHGGGFLIDSGSSPWYDGTSFAKEGDVVLVTINYRLGPFGFLNLAEFGNEEYKESGNSGLLDQVEALKWVKENISFFGGDPERITIFGESAGGQSVAMLMGMPSAKGLFNQAILQSPSGDLYSSFEDATDLANRMLNTLDIKLSELSKLETMPAEKIIEAAGLLKESTYKTAVFQPVIDGNVLPVDPHKAIEAGSAKDISILIGANKDEYRLHMALNPSWKEMDDEQKKNFVQNYVGAQWPNISTYYLASGTTGEALSDSMIQALGALRFTIPAIKIAESQNHHGSKVWMYRFDWQSPMHNGVLGACHFMEVPFVFNQLDHPDAVALTGKSSSRYDLAKKMHQAWIAFAKYGNPNASVIPEWPSYDLVNRATMIFDSNSKVENDPNSEERLVWGKTKKASV